MTISTFLNYILVIDTGSVSVVSILFQNLDDFLETAQKNKRYWLSQYSYIYFFLIAIILVLDLYSGLAKFLN